MHELQNLKREEGAEIFDANAYTVSAVYAGGLLELYAHHPTRPGGPGTPTDYHMTLIEAWALHGPPRAFREGATAFRNARDMAYEQRESFIKAANSRLVDATDAHIGSALSSQSLRTGTMDVDQPSQNEIEDSREESDNVATAPAWPSKKRKTGTKMGPPPKPKSNSKRPTKNGTMTKHPRTREGAHRLRS